MSALPSLASLGDVSLINNILVSVGVLVSALSQALTNGASDLGTLPSPNLPYFLCSGDSCAGQPLPWGNRTANGTNYYEDVPDTGVTRYYDFTVSRGIIAPDGYEKPSILINDQFPGPLIEANWGDMIQVTVHNNISSPEEGLVLHWHGLTQKKTPWYDGVAAVQQCPIAPGNAFTYNFQADLYGTSWYHSHYSAQYAGGLLGPMVIYGPTNLDYDFDLGPVILSDYYHRDYVDIVADIVGTDVFAALAAPAGDNTIINGKMYYDCSLAAEGTTCISNAGLSKFNFTSGKLHRLRLINTSGTGIQLFSIDDHDLIVIANDYVPVEPYTTNVVTLGVGQRTDVLVNATGKPGDTYWMRTRIPVLCSLTKQPFALAAIYYEGADTTERPQSLPQADWLTPVLLNCANDDLAKTVPFYPITPTPTPETTVLITIEQKFNSTGHQLWLMNGQTFRGNYNDPLLLLANEGNDSYPLDPQWNAYNFGTNSSIRIIFQNTTPFNHPMHIHGHNMYVLAFGVGVYDPSDPPTITNPSNPQRRDTAILPPSGYLVTQIDADNPGVWPFHCHIAWHVSAGLYINVIERPDLIEGLEIPQSVKDTCVAWSVYEETNVVDQIDSGLKIRERESQSFDWLGQKVV